MAWWLVRSSPDRVVRVRALAGDTVLCSWARHLTLTVPLSPPRSINGTGELLRKPNKLRGNDLRWTSIPSRGCRNTPSRFMLQKPGISSGAMSQSALRLQYFMCIFTWTAPFRNFHFINGEITRVRTSNYTFKCDLQTSFQQLLNSKGNGARADF